MRIRNIKNADELINNSEAIIIKPEDYKNEWSKLFNNNNSIHLEIGMGKGNFIIDMALNNPNINFIGLEKYTSVIVRAIKKLEGRKLDNLKLINGDALNLNNYFGKEISRIYLNFSDPWPKKRTARRRLTSEIFLKIYDGIFKGDCDIMQKTDNQVLFESSIISLSNYGYVFEDISLDLWATDKTYSETEYEHKFKNQGIKIKYLKAMKKVSKTN